MPSLLDQVLASKENPSADALLSPQDDAPHTLSDGSVIYDSTIAAINRILSLNPHLHKRSTGVTSHPYELYNGHTPVDLLDKHTFLSLLKADWEPQTRYQSTLLVDKVMELAPTLSYDGFAITDTLFWDRANQTLVDVPPNSIKTVS